ncbi:hypothetical protein KUV62_15865 [Salipiger bermudensis]|uniref:hypothetical protein n=1 Tax=Salipiger bermudensis TaxID=344736 RepID=UPI001C98FB25|nr:hypothetical protein [Salipiger bermudensis]MBY6005402.1 hypothetical protein [Salipiger bermudensis]
MSKTKAWAMSRAARLEAEEYIALIGKTTTRSTVAAREGEHVTAGSLTKLVVQTEIHFQPYDGATNYHKSKAFDEALSTVTRKRWSDLQAEAMELLRQREKEAAVAARAEVEAQLAEINEAEAEIHNPA